MAWRKKRGHEPLPAQTWDLDLKDLVAQLSRSLPIPVAVIGASLTTFVQTRANATLHF
jgi:hypothetical protein